MKKIFLIVIVLFSVFPLFSQNQSELNNAEKDFGITLNYFGEFDNHSGIEIGLESSIFKEMFMAYQVGFYFVEEGRTDVSLYWEMGLRKTFKSSYSPDVSAGIGYLTTYVPDNATEGRELLEIVYMPSISLGVLGFDFRKTKNIPLRIFGNVMFYWSKPIGKSADAKTAVQVGATYYFK